MDIDYDEPGGSPCGTCGGQNEVMGQLGTREHSRCRNCGITSSRSTVEALTSPSSSRTMGRGAAAEARFKQEALARQTGAWEDARSKAPNYRPKA